MLILVSIFERRVVILPDTGLHAQIGGGGLQPVIGTMTALLAEGSVCDALCGGIAGVEALLAAREIHATGNEGAGLPDAVIEESGDDAHS